MSDDKALLDAMEAKLNAAKPALQKADDYYEGNHPLAFVTPAVSDLMGDRVAPVVCNLTRLAVDEVVNRLDVEGFRLAGESSANDELWDIWQGNNLDEESVLGFQEGVNLGRAYIVTGRNTDDPKGGLPVVTFETPMNAWVDRDALTRKVTRYAKFTVDKDAEVEYRTLMLPDRSTTYIKEKGKDWKVHTDDKHNLGVVTVQVLPHKGSLRNMLGTPLCADIFPVNDAANKWLSDLMIAGEYTTIQRRWATGMKKSDFEDSMGKVRTAFKQHAQAIWATENSDARMGSFEIPDLANFHTSIKLLLQISSQLLGLPSHYISFDTVNAPSGEGIVSEESRWVKRCERVANGFGGALEEAMRDTYRVLNRDLPPGAMRLETLWRNAATPTQAQTTDATVKKFQAGLIDLEQAQQDLGYSPEARARMRADALVEAGAALAGIVKEGSNVGSTVAGSVEGVLPANAGTEG